MGVAGAEVEVEERKLKRGRAGAQVWPDRLRDLPARAAAARPRDALAKRANPRDASSGNASSSNPFSNNASSTSAVATFRSEISRESRFRRRCTLRPAPRLAHHDFFPIAAIQQQQDRHIQHERCGKAWPESKGAVSQDVIENHARRQCQQRPPVSGSGTVSETQGIGGRI